MDKEYVNFIKDYRDCLDRINNFQNYNYAETELWATKKYIDWISKDKRYALPLTENTNIPVDNMEKAWNAINNFKIVLDTIAIMKRFKI